mgnify:CR=1 FL=1
MSLKRNRSRALLRRGVVFAVAALLIAAVAGQWLPLQTLYTAAQPMDSGQLRFIHAIPGAPAVDVYVDSRLAAVDLAFGEATRFLGVEPGGRMIMIAASGSTAPIFQGIVTTSPDLGQTLVAQGTPDAIEVGVYESDLNPTRPGTVRITAIHAIKDGPPVDILQVDGQMVMPLIQGLAYSVPYGAVDIPANAADIVVVPAGGNVSNAVLRVPDVAMVAGTEVMVVALGTLSGAVPPSALVLLTPTEPEDPAGSVLVRLVHASAESPAVDVYVNSTLVAPGLRYETATPHVALPAGAADIAIRVAGAAPDSTPLASAALDLDGGTALTVVVSGPTDGLVVTPFANNVAPLGPEMARVQVINAAGGAATLNLAVGEGVATVSSADQAVLEIGMGYYDATLIVDTPSLFWNELLPLSGGVLYDFIVMGDAQSPRVIIATTGLNEQPGSAPAMPAPAAPAVAVEPPAPTEPPAVASLPTPAPFLVPTLTPETAPPPPVLVPPQPDVVTATPVTFSADVATSLPPPPPIIIAQAPTSTPFGRTGIFGQVDTNPGVNLKIREYPREDALTLALAPSGTVLEIVGVRGPAREPNVPTPEATATLDAEGVTIDQVWVFVIWRTDDGGTITGWTRPGFLIVTNERGRRVSAVADLLAFNQVPENEFGTVQTGIATPIPTPDNRVRGRVVRLNEGINLQIRRTPGIDGQSLALVPNGVELFVYERTEVASQGGLIGEPASLTWLYVGLETDTGTLTGWVNSQYIDLYWRGRPYPLEDIPESGTDLPRGDVQGNVVVSTPPPAPGLVATIDRLNPGANLHLRRTPDSNSESLNLIPAGSQIPVLGRNGAGTWLLVRYNNIEGWINGAFVSVTRNGRAFDIGEITIAIDEPDTFGQATPTPTTP